MNPQDSVSYSGSSDVLIVEDEEDLADTYARVLNDMCNVHVAYDGDEGIEMLDAMNNVDIVFLDRQMPNVSGDEVLETIRDREYDVQVAMVTGVEPDFDIVEMPFDDYIVKPVTSEDLLDAMDRMLLRGTYDQKVQELFSLVCKKVVLKREKEEAELRTSEEFRRLNDRIASVRAALDNTAANLIDSGGVGQVKAAVAGGDAD